jgi:hypothetical protein
MMDDRETIQIDLSDEEFLYVAKRAHERDITFNAMLEEIIKNYMNSLEQNVAG